MSKIKIAQQNGPNIWLLRQYVTIYTKIKSN